MSRETRRSSSSTLSSLCCLYLYMKASAFFHLSLADDERLKRYLFGLDTKSFCFFSSHLVLEDEKFNIHLLIWVISRGSSASFIVPGHFYGMYSRTFCWRIAVNPNSSMRHSPQTNSIDLAKTL